MDPIAALKIKESGGNYNAVGDLNARSGPSYGAYQIQGRNIPSWTKEALGYSLTPQQFLADPQAQDTVANYKFNQYQQQFGSPEAAAAAWNGGPGQGAAYAGGGNVLPQVNSYVSSYSGILNGGGADTGMPGGSNPEGALTGADPNNSNSNFVAGYTGSNSLSGSFLDPFGIGTSLFGTPGTPSYNQNAMGAGGSSGAWLNQLIVRAILFILGAIFVAVGLSMLNSKNLTLTLVKGMMK